MKLYRIEFRPEAVYALGNTALDAKRSAVDSVGAIIRQATPDELIIWMHEQMAEMQQSLKEIDAALDKELKADCE